MSVGFLDTHVRRGGDATVLQHIRECLLDDAIRKQVHADRKLRRDVEDQREIHPGLPELIHEFVELVQGGLRTELVGRRFGAKHTEEMAELGERRAARFLHRAQRLLSASGIVQAYRREGTFPNGKADIGSVRNRVDRKRIGDAATHRRILDLAAAYRGALDKEAAYAELFFTDVLWPEFRREHLATAVQAFERRERRFGGLRPVIAEPAHLAAGGG